MKISTQKGEQSHANVQSCPYNEKREFKTDLLLGPLLSVLRYKCSTRRSLQCLMQLCYHHNIFSIQNSYFQCNWILTSSNLPELTLLQIGETFLRIYSQWVFKPNNNLEENCDTPTFKIITLVLLHMHLTIICHTQVVKVLFANSIINYYKLYMEKNTYSKA